MATAGLDTTEAKVATFLFLLLDAVGGLAGLACVRVEWILTDESP